jgi:hypothetical protein
LAIGFRDIMGLRIHRAKTIEDTFGILIILSHFFSALLFFSKKYSYLPEPEFSEKMDVITTFRILFGKACRKVKAIRLIVSILYVMQI